MSLRVISFEQGGRSDGDLGGFLRIDVTLGWCPKLALGATGVRLRSPVLFAFRCEIQKTLAAQSCRQWHPLFVRDKPQARFHNPRAKLLLSRRSGYTHRLSGSAGASPSRMRRKLVVTVCLATHPSDPTQGCSRISRELDPFHVVPSACDPSRTRDRACLVLRGICLLVSLLTGGRLLVPSRRFFPPMAD